MIVKFNQSFNIQALVKVTALFDLVIWPSSLKLNESPKAYITEMYKLCIDNKQGLTFSYEFSVQYNKIGPLGLLEQRDLQ